MDKVTTDLIETLEGTDWTFAQSSTRHLTHAIHRYSGKFIPKIPHTIINHVSRPGDTILDPYCGSGTTLLEASLLSRHSIGVDLNPIAALIAKVKTTPVSRSRLERAREHLINELACISNFAVQGPLADVQIHDPCEVCESDPRWADDWFQKWFQPRQLYELICIHRAISELDEDVGAVAAVAFSDILRRTSNAHSSYPNVMFDKNRGEVPLALPLFFSRFQEVAQAVSSLNGAIEDRFIPKVLLGDAKCLPLADDSVDSVITHPPYIGSIPYAEYNQLSLTWLGYDPKQLDSSLTGGRRQSKDVILRFEVDYSEMFRESTRVLKPGGYMFVMVGNPRVKGKLVDLTEMSLRFAATHGLSLVWRGARGSINRRSNQMGSESLLLFLKAATA